MKQTRRCPNLPDVRSYPTLPYCSYWLENIIQSKNKVWYFCESTYLLTAMTAIVPLLVRIVFSTLKLPLSTPKVITSL